MEALERIIFPEGDRPKVLTSISPECKPTIAINVRAYFTMKMPETSWCSAFAGAIAILAVRRKR
jgi:hypothetical protein